MKITVNELIALNNTMKELMGKNFSGVNAFKIARLTRELTKEMDAFDATRLKIVEKYTLRDEDGNPVVDETGTSVKIQPDKIAECNAEFTNLLETEIELNVSKLDESVLGEIGDITPQQAMALEPVVEI